MLPPPRLARQIARPYLFGHADQAANRPPDTVAQEIERSETKTDSQQTGNKGDPTRGGQLSAALAERALDSLLLVGPDLIENPRHLSDQRRRFILKCGLIAACGPAILKGRPPREDRFQSLQALLINAVEIAGQFIKSRHIARDGSSRPRIAIAVGG